MGGRGAFNHKAGFIPVENRRYKQIGEFNGIKIIDSDTIKNGKTPVMSNTANTAYAIWSQTAGRIKSILFYKKHILYKEIDIMGTKSHWHNVSVDKTTGEIGRTTHDKSNTFKLSKSQWKLVKVLSKWRKK